MGVFFIGAMPWVRLPDDTPPIPLRARAVSGNVKERSLREAAEDAQPLPWNSARAGEPF